jgi:predicted metal-dependent enzyme (double-stranded beta helix superfamily)
MFEIDRFIADCRQALRDPRPEAATRDAVARAVAEPGDVENALGTPREGGLFVLHRAPDLTILNVVWTPGMFIYPHDHRMWAVIGLYGGREDNTFYRRTAEGLVASGDKPLRQTETVLLGKSVIHAVANPLRTFTGAIHIYGGDFFAAERSEWCPETLAERPFDMGRARGVFAAANERWRREMEADAQSGR